jgi:hypothetical protein
MKNGASMYKEILRIFLLILVLFALCLLFQTCDDSGVDPSKDFVSGTITLADTNLISSGGYYAMSVFSAGSSPFSNRPIRSDSLNLQRSGDVYTGYYKINGLAAGDYYVGATWIHLPFDTNAHPPVLGTYGCDTTHNCTTSTKVTFPSYAGTAGCNFLCWTDTTMRIF